MFPGVALAATSADVTVTARGLVLSAPEGFVVVYLDDTHVELYWTNNALSTDVMLRYKLDSYPASRADGNLLYAGNGTYVAHNIDLTSASMPYYRIWSHNATTGIWEKIGSIGIGDFMTQSWMLMILLLYALAISTLPILIRVMFGNVVTKTLIVIAASISWLAIIAFINESAEAGFVFSFEPNWAKLFIISILAFMFNIIVVSLGTIIDKSGKISMKIDDKRSRSKKSADDYASMLREKISSSNKNTYPRRKRDIWG